MNVKNENNAGAVVEEAGGATALLSLVLNECLDFSNAR
jgi:hypothetical protein